MRRMRMRTIPGKMKLSMVRWRVMMMMMMTMLRRTKLMMLRILLRRRIKG